MATVDDKVVQLKFDNKQFESATAASMSTLDKLKKSLDFSSSRKGVDDLSGAFNRFSMGSLPVQVEGVSARFLALATIGVTALSNIATKAIETGATLIKSLTIDPITTGFQEYETNLNAIQTILANTSSAGTNLKDVQKALDELNKYSDETIYNFAEMARNIGTFTAAGVALKPATAAIKGIANLAALSGSNAQQASTAMYQLSQALAAGRVTLMDWNSVVNAGMGGAVFQRALAMTAEKLGTIKDGAVKLQGPMKNVTIAGLSFRESISDPKVGGWLTSDVLTKTLQQFTGDLTDAQIAAMGFTKEEVKAIQTQAQAAKEAATQVKTLPQLIDVTREAVQSGWAETWMIVFGNYNESRRDMTALGNVIGTFVQNMSDARNTILEEWKAFGGRNDAIQGLINLFNALMSVIKPIAQAWANVFPPTTGKQLADITRSLRLFFRGLILGPAQMHQLQMAFQGLFSILDIGKKIISGVFGFFKNIFNLLTAGGGKASGGILAVAGSIGEALVQFDRFLTGTNAIPAFFDRLEQAIGPVVVRIGDFIRTVADAVGGALRKLPDILGRIGGAAQTAKEQGITPLANAWQTFVDILKNVGAFLSNMASAIVSTFQGTGDAVGNVFDTIGNKISNLNWVAIFKGVIAGGFVAVIVAFFKALWAAIDLVMGPAKIMSGMANVLNNLGGVLQSYQNNLRAKSLLAIAGAILALAVAVKILSTIDPAALAVSVVAIGVMFKMLSNTMDSMTELMNGKKGLSVVSAAAGLVLLAGAMLLFVAAIKLLSMMDLGTLTKGITSLAVVLGILTATVRLMAANTGSMFQVGAGLLLLALAINALIIPIQILGRTPWDVLAKGGSAILGLMLMMSVAIRTMPKTGQMLKASASILIFALAINALIAPLLILGKIDSGTLLQGAIGIAALLTMLVVSMNAMGTGPTLAGAAATLIVSAALLVLAGAIAFIGNLPIPVIVTGILALVIAMAAIGVVALALSEAIPFVLAFGIAIMALGAGLALVGLGMLAFATALSIVVGLATLGIPVLADAMNNIIELIPLFMKGLLVAIVEFNKTLIAAFPSIFKTIEMFLINFLNLVDRMTPRLMKTVGILMDAFLAFIVKYIPKIADVGLQIIDGLLKAIAKNLPSIIENGKDVIIAWIKGIGKASADIAKAAGDTLLTFLTDIANWIETNKQRIHDVGYSLAKAIIDGVVAGFSGLVQAPLDAVGGFFGGLIEKARQVLDSHSPSKVFIKIGQDIMKGLTIGMQNGRQAAMDNVNAIFSEIKDASRKASEDIGKLNDKIKTLQSKPMTTANKRALAQAKADLAAAQATKKAMDAAYKTVSKEHLAQIVQLEKLAGQYEVVKTKLEEAQKVLDDAKKQRDDFAKSVKDQYNVLPEIADTTSLDDYFNNIRKATEANLRFKATLEELRKAGLDDTSYRKFLEAGVSAQPFLDKLLEAGSGAITELGNIDSSLEQSAASLGNSASTALYQAGVDAAQGLVDGLSSQMSVITGKMTVIAKAIVDEIKRELGIKSPSKVFAEIGANTMIGLAQGMERNTNVIDMTARRAGQIAVESLKQSLSSLEGGITADLDIQPVVAPVLDLTAFRKDAMGMNDILKTNPLEATVSAQNAASIVSTTAALKALQEASMAQQMAPTTIEFTQNNNSPKALSSAEIYRQTKNQLSIVKEALPG